MSHFPAGPWRGLSSCCLNGGLGQEVNLQRVPPRNLQARPSRPPHPAPSKLASLIKTAQPSPRWGEGSKKKPSPPACGGRGLRSLSEIVDRARSEEHTSEL